MSEELKNQTTSQRGLKKTIAGVVVSDKMDKTRVIEVKRRLFHPLYKKNFVQKTRFKIHDEKNESQAGQEVLAVACRPLSKSKSYRLLKVLGK